jgi:myosin-1
MDERVLFCSTVVKYDRRFKAQEWDLFVTERVLVMLGWEKMTSGPQKGQLCKVEKRRIPLTELAGISISTLCDDFVVLHIPKEHDQVLECKFKTEMVLVLKELFERIYQSQLSLTFFNTIQYSVKKTRWEGAGERTLKFVPSQEAPSVCVLPTNNKKVTDIAVPPGLPNDSKPSKLAANANLANVSKHQQAQNQQPIGHPKTQEREFVKNAPPPPPPIALGRGMPPPPPPPLQPAKGRGMES